MSNFLARRTVFIVLFGFAITGAAAEQRPSPAAGAEVQIWAYYADVWDGLSLILGSRELIFRREEQCRELEETL